MELSLFTNDSSYKYEAEPAAKIVLCFGFGKSQLLVPIGAAAFIIIRRGYTEISPGGNVAVSTLLPPP